MDHAWPPILLSLLLCLFLSWRFLFHGKVSTCSGSRSKVPPSPASIPVIGDLLWLSRTTIHRLNSSLRQAQLGPVVSLNLGLARLVFVLDRGLAYQALIQRGALFADHVPSRSGGPNEYGISGSNGARWRLLRRNLVQEVFHPQRLRAFAEGRAGVLHALLDQLRAQSVASENGVIELREFFHHAVTDLLVYMCFGERLEESKVRAIKEVEYARFRIFPDIAILDAMPRMPRILLWTRWRKFREIRRREDAMFMPLVSARREDKHKQQPLSCYLDSLLMLEIPEEGGRKLTDDQIVTLCAEFLSAGADTTTTVLEWVMANLVKYPDIQQRLFHEMATVIGDEHQGRVIQEDDVEMMPYLKAVVLEALRRHPIGDFIMPRVMAEDIELGGYLLPKGSLVVFEMGLDKAIWEDPLQFKPERFLDAGRGQAPSVDITGSKGIKMIPFGAGRRMCPAMGVSVLHLEYFLTNLIWEFDWKAAEEVDLSDDYDFTVVMKQRLRARILPRRRDNQSALPTTM